MSARTIILLISLIFISDKLFSQKNVIKVDMFGAIITTVVSNQPIAKVSYERAFARHFSGQLSLEYGKYWKGESAQGNFPMTEMYNLKGIGLMPAIRYYPFTGNNEAPMGFFISAHYRFYSVTEHYFKEPLDIKTNGNVNNFGLNIGFKHGGGMLIAEYLLGFGTSSGHWVVPNERNKIPSTEDFVGNLNDFAIIRFELNLGFRFPMR